MILYLLLEAGSMATNSSLFLARVSNDGVLYSFTCYFVSSPTFLSFDPL